MPLQKSRTPGTARIKFSHKGKTYEKTIKVSPGKQGKAEALEYEVNWKRLLCTGQSPDLLKAPSFESFVLERYKPHAIAHLKALSWQGRQYHLDTLNRFLGGLRLNEITAERIDAFQTARAACVANSTVNSEVMSLSAVLTYARKIGFDIKKPDWTPLPVRGHGRVKYWTLDEVQRLYDAAAQVRCESFAAMLVFLINTGCRKGEAVAAEWSWVDFERGMLRIPSNEAWQPKNGLPREVPLSDALRTTLERMDRRTPYLFRPPTGGGIRYAEFPKHYWNETRKRAGVIGNIHRTRHTYASMFLATTPNLPLLAKVLGHGATRVTQIYAHLDPRHLEQARNAVNVGLRGAVAVPSVAARLEAELAAARAVPAVVVSIRGNRGKDHGKAQNEKR